MNNLILSSVAPHLVPVYAIFRTNEWTNLFKNFLKYSIETFTVTHHCDSLAGRRNARQNELLLQGVYKFLSSFFVSVVIYSAPDSVDSDEFMYPPFCLSLSSFA